jgi:hypothetical protein
MGAMLALGEAVALLFGALDGTTDKTTKELAVSDRRRPEKGAFEKLIEEVASGKVAWERFEQELSAANDLTEREKEEVRTDAQCRRIERLERDPTIDQERLQKELSAFPPLTDGTRRFIGKGFREGLLESAVSQGLRARGKTVDPLDDAQDIVALYSTCNPRDGAESALARLVPIILHSTTICFERAEKSESLEARYYELANGFRGARALAQIKDSLHKDRPERSRKTK